MAFGQENPPLGKATELRSKQWLMGGVTALAGGAVPVSRWILRDPKTLDGRSIARPVFRREPCRPRLSQLVERQVPSSLRFPCLCPVSSP